MELRNADGGRAETSGNGLRCFALAAIDAGLVPGPEVAIETDAGVRRAVLRRQRPVRLPPRSRSRWAAFGSPSLSPVADVSLPGSAAQPWPAWFVDAGNPHLVLLAPSMEGVDIAEVGPRLEKMRPGGQNVEIVAHEPGRRAVTRRVGARRRGHARLWERERGRRRRPAFGGDLRDRVLVHNPGGTAEVVLSGDDPLAVLATLAGPARRVARNPGRACRCSASVGCGRARETGNDHPHRPEVPGEDRARRDGRVASHGGGGRGEPRRARPARRHSRCR